MATRNFEAALEHVLKSEGGYVNDKRDPGGETNMGISKRSYPSENIKGMTRKRAGEIYRRDFWNAVRGDELPSGVDLAVFDAAVNSGPVRAIKWLQAALEVPQDGIFGAITQTALRQVSPEQVINRVCVHRLAFMQRLGTWPVYGKGWQSRVDRVREAAIDMVGPEPDQRQDWIALIIEALLGLWKK